MTLPTMLTRFVERQRHGSNPKRISQALVNYRTITTAVISYYCCYTDSNSCTGVTSRTGDGCVQANLKFSSFWS